VETIEIKVYSFDELSDEVKKDLIEKQRERNGENLEFSNDFIQENIASKLDDEYGIVAKSSYWDWNNRYDCGFDGYVEDFEKFFNKIGFKEFNELKDSLSMSITWDWGRNGMRLGDCTDPVDEEYLSEMEDEDDLVTLPERLRVQKAQDLWENLHQYLSGDFISEMSRLVWEEVDDSYTYETSEEVAIERLRENKYLESGEEWN